MNIEQTITKIFKKYKFSEEERRKFLSMVFPVLCHEEFKKRMDNTLYPHHDTTSLGEHILSDAAVAFQLTEDKDYVNQYLAVLIAMFHDLYEIPWQNSGIIKNDFFNKHGFVHPLEAAINAATWYSEYFQEPKKAAIIIDGIVHHMFPFPVRSLNGDNAELNNEIKLNNLPITIRNMIISSSLRNKIGKISLCRSEYPEGRIVSKADKIVSFNKDFTISGSIACITGINNKLKRELKQEQKNRGC